MTRVGLHVEACALGQASAALLARHAPGRGLAEIRAARERIAGWFAGSYMEGSRAAGLLESWRGVPTEPGDLIWMATAAGAVLGIAAGGIAHAISSAGEKNRSQSLQLSTTAAGGRFAAAADAATSEALRAFFRPDVVASNVSRIRAAGNIGLTVADVHYSETIRDSTHRASGAMVIVPEQLLLLDAGGNLMHAFWLDPSDSMIHHGNDLLSGVPLVRSKAARFQVESRDSFVVLTALELRAGTGQIVRTSSSFALLNR